MERVFRQAKGEQLLPPRRILHINVTRIGDTLLATPVIRALATRYPNAELTCLGHPKRVEVLEHLPFVREVGSITKKTAIWQGWLPGKRWDLAIVHGFDEALVRYALRVSDRVVAFHQADEQLNRRLYRAIRRPELDSVPAVDVQLPLAKIIGVEPDGRYLSYQVSDAERSVAQGRLLAAGVNDRDPLVGMVVESFPTKPYRNWPISHFVETAQRTLGQFPNAHFVLLGGELPADKVAQVRSALRDRVTVLAGQLSLRESGAVMSLLDLYIGVDTGPTHLAGALGIPMISLYHCMHRGRWLAPREHSKLVVIEHPASDVECSAQHSMAEISVDTVMPHVSALLEAKFA
ncbi:glycosyltransferase family 9 protein [Chitinivorax sp. B]|uniref:glycosyltransferase family 9 protein n=1 Tax=Chitinivorax sp. B TaxID=2502235 RepID=UPI0024B49F0A|nr:glycosyltransferase family 9 protein [Chitinivorax sp. B]